jgi:hypothetical protein
MCWPESGDDNNEGREGGGGAAGIIDLTYGKIMIGTLIN